MLLAALALAGCGGGNDAGSVELYHLEAQLDGPVEDPEITCGTIDTCPNAGDSPRLGYSVTGDPRLDTDDFVTERAQALVADVTGQPAVTLDLTADGQAKFHDFTRELVRIGRGRGEPQRIAVVVGDALVSWPAIDYEQYPDGLTAETGIQIAVATVEDAQRLAREIRGED